MPGEITRCLDDVIQQNNMVRQRIAAVRIEPQAAFRDRLQVRTGVRVAGGEQHDVVSLANQFVRQIRDYAFRSAVQARWHALEERRDDGNTQDDLHTADPNDSALPPQSARVSGRSPEAATRRYGASCGCRSLSELTFVAASLVSRAASELISRIFLSRNATGRAETEFSTARPLRNATRQ